RFDPGTQQPKSFTSEVLLSDLAGGVKDKPVTITMNEPMVHRHLTFYQSSYSEGRDPQTGQGNGQFNSVLQVGYDPGRPVKYFGCALVVFGAFVQFYMRAGIFTDGGKKERARSAAREARRGKKPADEAGAEEPEPL